MKLKQVFVKTSWKFRAQIRPTDKQKLADDFLLVVTVFLLMSADGIIFCLLDLIH
jgi:hypothetical protein